MNDGVEVSVNKHEGSSGKVEKTMIVVRWGCLSVITQGRQESMTRYARWQLRASIVNKKTEEI